MSFCSCSVNGIDVSRPKCNKCLLLRSRFILDVRRRLRRVPEWKKKFSSSLRCCYLSDTSSRVDFIAFSWANAEDVKTMLFAFSIALSAGYVKSRVILVNGEWYCHHGKGVIALISSLRFTLVRLLTVLLLFMFLYVLSTIVEIVVVVVVVLILLVVSAKR